MIFHPEEYRAAQEYWQGREFPHITPGQMARIKERGGQLLRFHMAHPGVHHLINFTVLALFFAGDWWVLLRLGHRFASPVWAGIVVGALHGMFMYFISVFTLHEGAAHKLIVLRGGRVSRFFSAVVNNLNRISFAETGYYARNHLSHHAHFTTEKDDEFLNFVRLQRFGRCWIPFAGVFNFADFKSHAGMRYTPSRLISFLVTALYQGTFAFFMLQVFPVPMVAVALVLVFPYVEFILDRLRQYSEHNVMPLNPVDGARDLGLDIWGFLVGGGLGGQPCHWSHHLYPGIPWYNQARMHLFIGKLLTPEQKKRFFLAPVIGFPRMLIEVSRVTAARRGKMR